MEYVYCQEHQSLDEDQVHRVAVVQVGSELEGGGRRRLVGGVCALERRGGGRNSSS